MQPLLLTYRDAIDHLTEFVGGQSLSAAQRDIRRAIHAALREVESAHEWTYYNTPGRVPLTAPYRTGTVTYVHTSRAVTLTGGVFPTNARDCYIRIGDLVCAVESRTSDTQVILDYDLNPGANISTATAFCMYPAWYALPEDFASTVGPWRSDLWGELEYVTPSQWLALDRFSGSTGNPRFYTIMGVPDLHGSLGLFVHPAADVAGTLDHIYRRRARQLRYSGYGTAETAGTVSFVSGSALVTGSGTAFQERMVGSVIRLGDSASIVPTGLDGLCPFTDERTIGAVASATGITLDNLVSSTYSGVKYVVSDIVDIDPAAINLFLRCCEKHLALNRNMKTFPQYAAAYEDALFAAKCGQRRTDQIQVARPPCRITRPRLASYPIGEDVP